MSRASEDDASQNREQCLVCEADLAASDLYARLSVCPECRFHYTITARERIGLLADPGSFKETSRTLTSLDPLSFSSRAPYKERLFRDQRRTGLTEAAVTGVCTIGGSPAVLTVLDFGFMGGSMGCVVGEKVALALELAAKRRVAAVAVVTSGGARIQEGLLSLMQMAKTAMAAGRLEESRSPFISVLANPATGQAYASFANLADVILAEPGAIVGLAPLRVLREASLAPLPPGSHTSESHLAHGMIDAIVDRERLRDRVGALLDLMGPGYRLTPAAGATTAAAPEGQPGEPWDSVLLARHAERPTAQDYISAIFTDFVELHGDRSQGDDPAVVCGLGHLGGQTVMVVAQERGREGDPVDRHHGRALPEGFRKAQRAMGLAAKFGFPLIALVDTPGPYSTLESEERGLGNAIATTMAAMARLEVPTVAAVIGEGGSEGALALAVADRILMLENAIYTIISPEDAASLLYHDRARAEEAAEALKLTAHDCLERRIVHEVVPEPPGGAHSNPAEAARLLRRALQRHLADIQATKAPKRLKARYKTFRKMGEYSSHFRASVQREVASLQGLVKTGVRRIARRPSRRLRRSDGGPAAQDPLALSPGEGPGPTGPS